MIRVVVQTVPTQFFDGLDLEFYVRQGKREHKYSHRMTVHDLLNTTILDAALAEARRVLNQAIADHKRDCASAEPMH